MSPPSPASSPITPPQWQGLIFFVLPKQEFVRVHGYELFTCKKKECDTAQVDPAWELDNHRIRCEAVSGDSLLVETVEPDGDEWLITFFHIPTNKRIFARTHRQAIQEIARADDLAGARLRWLGKVIFAKRGVISTFGTNSATSITSLRVNIQDSLIVVDVRWGLTPLPVKPLWIMVTTTTGKSGFIPVRYSWTNTMTGEIAGSDPWDEDIFERNPTFIYDWDESTWEIVNNHRVILEMTPDQVRTSWGHPLSTGIIRSGETKHTIWTYPSHELIFTNSKLSAIKERPSPQR